MLFIGNCFNFLNLTLFQYADVGIGMKAPAALIAPRDNYTYQGLTAAQFASTIISSFCSLDDLSFESCPYVVTEIIREGRSLLSVTLQVF